MKRVQQEVLINDCFSIQAEAYQRVQVNIDYASVDKKIKCIGVISANQNEGKSTTAANLSVLYGLKGKKTILIDLDLRMPTVHRLCGIDNINGVTDYCLGKATKEKIIKHSNGIDVITAGEQTSFPTNVLQSEKLKNLFEELRKEYDYIIVDVPPILVVADGIIISQLIDGYVNVVVSNQTKRNELKDTVNIFKQNNLKMIGVILTRVKLNKRSYESYRYYAGGK